MKRQKFITAENLPIMTRAFADSVDPALRSGGDVTVLLIGEPGVGKSYISGKMSDAVTGPHVTALTMTVPRDNMHDLILWSVRESESLQIRQVDEASTRFVGQEYRDFVIAQRELHPVPPRVKPGITFVEHPDPEMEEASDIVVRLSFSEHQRAAILMLRDNMFGAAPEIIASIKDDIARVMAQGCLLEMEFQGNRVDRVPLIDFFDEPEAKIGREDDEPDLELAL